jgi:aspartyl/asparaginyl-tRNA synthetase
VCTLCNLLLHCEKDVADKDVLQITYTEAVDLLSRANKKFEFPVTQSSILSSPSVTNLFNMQSLSSCSLFTSFFLHLFYAFVSPS